MSLLSVFITPQSVCQPKKPCKDLKSSGFDLNLRALSQDETNLRRKGAAQEFPEVDRGSRQERGSVAPMGLF